jgi:hypothetical protein
VTAIAEQEWQQVESRKARIAAQAERIATLAADRLHKKLESDDDISPSALVPIFGVAVDKMLSLRGDAALTIQHQHQHQHSHQHELIAALNAAVERIEKRANAGVVEVPALPPRDASVAGENALEKVT